MDNALRAELWFKQPQKFFSSFFRNADGTERPLEEWEPVLCDWLCWASGNRVSVGGVLQDFVDYEHYKAAHVCRQFLDAVKIGNYMKLSEVPAPKAKHLSMYLITFGYYGVINDFVPKGSKQVEYVLSDLPTIGNTLKLLIEAHADHNKERDGVETAT